MGKRWKMASHGRPAPRAEPALLDPATQPKFVTPLPIPERVDVSGGGTYPIWMRQIEQELGLVDPDTGAPLVTTVWGYDAGSGASYPGPTLIARSGVPVDVFWINELPPEHLVPVDVTVHWAYKHPIDGAQRTIATDGVPTVVHLHGGHSESASDGLPEAWFTPGYTLRGPHLTKTVDGSRHGEPLPYRYDNDQEAATLWYHDHTLGITRLNVYAGLGAFYLLRDANEDALVAACHLPTGPYEIELAIQDRMFTRDGQLHYPAAPPVPDAPAPSVLPEFFGDVILVNGKAWPVLDVEPRPYRLRMLNGSDSRFYRMWLAAPGELPFHQIGTDTGFLDAPVQQSRIVLAPGERADVIVDFSDPALAGETIILRNDAKAPFPDGDVVNPRTTGRIMAFRVSKPLDISTYPLTTLPAALRPTPIVPLVPSGATRQLLLFEDTDEHGRLLAMLGTVEGKLAWDDPITETPTLGDVEIWEVYNTTPDAHPIHLHLVSFQIVSRQKFSATVDPAQGTLTGIRHLGQPRPPDPGEAGPKDTVRMMPGEVTRIIARFDRPGRFVWHCHILSHEDHEMMRPYQVLTP